MKTSVCVTVCFAHSQASERQEGRGLDQLPRPLVTSVNLGRSPGLSRPQQIGSVTCPTYYPTIWGGSLLSKKKEKSLITLYISSLGDKNTPSVDMGQVWRRCAEGPRGHFPSPPGTRSSHTADRTSPGPPLWPRRTTSLFWPKWRVFGN